MIVELAQQHLAWHLLKRSLGFPRTIDYRQEDFTENEQDYDLILDPKTNRSIFKYLRVLKPHGTYVTVGGETPRLLPALFLSPIIRFFFKKNVLLLALKPNQDLDYINELFEAGQIKPVIEAPYKFAMEGWSDEEVNAIAGKAVIPGCSFIPAYFSSSESSDRELAKEMLALLFSVHPGKLFNIFPI